MAKRDPNKTARNKQVAELKNQLRALLPTVLAETSFKSEQSLNALIGHRADEFVDLKNEVMLSPQDYVSRYLEGFAEHRVDPSAEAGWGSFRTSHDDFYDELKKSKAAQEYLMLFLQRSYLSRYEEFAKKRPTVKEAELWMGQNAAEWGLLVSPRFVNGRWENDKSEIRRFTQPYWTIGHVIQTGLVAPGSPNKTAFNDVSDYLTFFENVLVRHSMSPHQKHVATWYRDYILASNNPTEVPLLIPELRYAGLKAKHVYRLDFCVIRHGDMSKIGFELSPWSTHGKLIGTKTKTVAQVNKEAAANSEKENEKAKAYFRKFGITTLIYGDSDLADTTMLFRDIKSALEPDVQQKQLGFHLMSKFFD